MRTGPDRRRNLSAVKGVAVAGVLAVCGLSAVVSPASAAPTDRFDCVGRGLVGVGSPGLEGVVDQDGSQSDGLNGDVTDNNLNSGYGDPSQIGTPGAGSGPHGLTVNLGPGDTLTDRD